MEYVDDMLKRGARFVRFTEHNGREIYIQVAHLVSFGQCDDDVAKTRLWLSYPRAYIDVVVDHPLKEVLKRLDD